MPNIPSINRCFHGARLKIPTPCHKCTDRKCGCHSTCERYSEYTNTLRDLKDKIATKYQSENMANDFIIKQTIKNQKK